jgi:GST-like protein
VACDEYSIADMAIFPWMRGAESRGIDMNEYPNVKRWFDGINARPAVQRALQVLSNESNSNPVDDKAREVMFGKTQFQQR